MENLNQVLLENVLPAHVAEHFLGRNWKNEVTSSSVCWCMMSPHIGFSILSSPAHLCYPLQGRKPLLAPSPLLFSVLTSDSLSESNSLFPAAVTHLTEMIKLSSYVFLVRVSPFGS